MEQKYLVIENRGPAVARNIAATVRSFVAGESLGITSWPDDTENDDDSLTISVGALAPGASCWRPPIVAFGAKSYRVAVDLKWHDESGARSDRLIVELV